MAASRFKMLFSDAPPDALEKLLSPRRKLFYGLFAFGPGTVLGLYLYFVKRRMDRENEVLRLEQVQGEINAVQEQQDKESALASVIQEMRDRLRRLEEEDLASRQSAANAAEQKAKEEKKLAASESKIEAALAVLKKGPEEQKAATSPVWLSSSLDGPQGRRDKRHQELLQQDVAEHIAKLKEQTK